MSLNFCGNEYPGKYWPYEHWSEQEYGQFFVYEVCIGIVSFESKYPNCTEIIQ